MSTFNFPSYRKKSKENVATAFKSYLLHIYGNEYKDKLTIGVKSSLWKQFSTKERYDQESDKKARAKAHTKDTEKFGLCSRLIKTYLNDDRIRGYIDTFIKREVNDLSDEEEVSKTANEHGDWVNQRKEVFSKRIRADERSIDSSTYFDKDCLFPSVDSPLRKKKFVPIESQCSNDNHSSIIDLDTTNLEQYGTNATNTSFVSKGIPNIQSDPNEPNVSNIIRNRSINDDYQLDSQQINHTSSFEDWGQSVHTSLNVRGKQVNHEHNDITTVSEEPKKSNETDINKQFRMDMDGQFIYSSQKTIKGLILLSKERRSTLEIRKYQNLLKLQTIENMEQIRKLNESNAIYKRIDNLIDDKVKEIENEFNESILIEDDFLSTNLE